MFWNIASECFGVEYAILLYLDVENSNCVENVLGLITRECRLISFVLIVNKDYDCLFCRRSQL